jgi:hypothetical protein
VTLISLISIGPTNVEYWFQTNYDQLSTEVTNGYYGSPTSAYYLESSNPYLEYVSVMGLGSHLNIQHLTLGRVSLYRESCGAL